MLNTLKNRVVLCGPYNEEHIRTLRYSADNHRRKTERQKRKRETNTNMDRRSQRLDWLQTIRTNKESRRNEALRLYMEHLQHTAVDATLDE